MPETALCGWMWPLWPPPGLRMLTHRLSSLSFLPPVSRKAAAAKAATAGVEARGGQPRASGLRIPRAELAAVGAALESAGVGPVTAAAPEYVFSPDCPPFEQLEARVG